MARGKGQGTLALINAAKRILEENKPASVRAVCYRLFTEKLIPDMSKASTNKVGVQLTYAREQGIIPWDHVVDESRHAEFVPTWGDDRSFFEETLGRYRKNLWRDQPEHVEIWSEKGTIRGTLSQLIDEFHLTFRVLHGFNSSTEVWRAARLSESYDGTTRVIYIGDFDPSGLFMSEVDLPARLERYRADVEINRVAITADDMAHSGYPEFPASDKAKDNRHGWFVANHGERCMEVDAMPPPILRQRVRQAIQAYIDADTWESALEVEQAELARIDTWKARILGQAS